MSSNNAEGPSNSRVAKGKRKNSSQSSTLDLNHQQSMSWDLMDVRVETRSAKKLKIQHYMEKIGDQVWEEIFSYLDIESLGNAAKVCKKWSSLIKSVKKVGESRKLEILPLRRGYSLSPFTIAGLMYGKVKIEYLLDREDVEEFCKTHKIYNLYQLKEYDFTELKDYFKEAFEVKFLHYIPKAHEIRSFPNLKQLQVEHHATYFGRDALYDFPTSSISDNQLTHLKLIIPRENLTPGEVFKLDSLLKRQTNSLQHLTIRGIDFDHKSMEHFVETCKSLKCLELELNVLSGSWDLLNKIKDHKDHQHKKWNQLTFKYISKELEELANRIMANHQEVTNPRVRNGYMLRPYPNVPFYEMTFKFAPEDRRLIASLDDFTKVLRLNIDDEFDEDFFARFPNVKILEIQEVRNVQPESIQTIFEEIKNLEELHLNTYGWKWRSAASICQIIHEVKAHGKNLKKLVLCGDEETREIIREEVKIFNDTKIQVFVIAPSKCELDDYYRGIRTICIWKK